MAYAIKANGAGESLLTTAFNKNYWPTSSLVSGIFDGNTGVQCIGRSGIGFIRANATVAADWPSGTKKKIMTLPEAYRPATNVFDKVQDGRWYIEILQNGDVTLTVSQAGAVAKGISCTFLISYPLKDFGGGVAEPFFIAVLHALKSRIKTGLTAFRKGGLSCQYQ